MTLRARLSIILAIIPVMVIVDQWTKYIVLNEPRFNALGCLDMTQRCGKIEISGIFDFSMLWNRGISYGLFQAEGYMRWVMVALTAAIAIGFGIWMFRAMRRLTTVALALVVAGAFGNLIDRVTYGAVVDFLDFGGLGFPYVFNVADMGVCVGAGLLFLDQFLISRHKTISNPSSEDMPL